MTEPLPISYPERCDVFELLKTICSDAGALSVCRGFYDPERDDGSLEFPIVAVIFSEEEQIEARSSGSRDHSGPVELHLWIKAGEANNLNDRNNNWKKVDLLKRAILDRIDLLIPTQGVTDTRLNLRLRGKYREFFWRVATAIGGEIEIEYNYQTIPPPEQSPGPIDILTD
jgi:hypothetical protein